MKALVAALLTLVLVPATARAAGGTTMGDAATLTGSASGTLSSALDEDWYAVYPASKAEQVVVKASNTREAGPGCMSVHVTLKGSDGRALTSLQIQPGDDAELKAGGEDRYFLTTDTTGCNAGSDPPVKYELELTAGGGGEKPAAASASVAPARLLADAHGLPGASSVKGSVPDGTTEDWYALDKDDGAAQVTVRVENTTLPEGECQTLGAALLDADGSPRTGVTVSRGTAFTFVVGTAGRYYVRLNDQGCEPGTGEPPRYRIETQPGKGFGAVEDAKPQLLKAGISIDQAAGPIAGGVEYEAQPKSPTVPGWVSFDTDPDDPQVKLRVTNAKKTAQADCDGVYVALTDGDGDPVRSVGLQRNQSTEFLVDEAGRHYLKLSYACDPGPGVPIPVRIEGEPPDGFDPGPAYGGTTTTTTTTTTTPPPPTSTTTPTPPPTVHYEVEAKSWIPQPYVVDPSLPVPFLPVLAGLLGATKSCTPPVTSLFPTELAESVFTGNAHTPYDPADAKVLVVVDYDWDGTAISDFRSQVVYGPTYRSIRFPFGAPTTYCLQGSSQATSAADGTQSGPGEFTVHVDSPNPDFTAGSFTVAPSIKADFTGTMRPDGSLVLTGATSLFPGHGVRVTRDGVQQLTDTDNDVSCLGDDGVLGIPGAATLFWGLTHQTGLTADLVTPDQAGVSHAEPSLLCAQRLYLIQFLTGALSGVAPVDAAGKPGAWLSPADAQAQGLVSVQRDGRVVSSADAPVAVRASGKRPAVVVASVRGGRATGAAEQFRAPGLVTTLGTSAVATSRGRRVKPRAIRAPRVRAHVTLRGRTAVVRLAAAGATVYAIDGARKLKLRHGTVKLPRAHLGSLRFGTVDLLGTTSKPARLTRAQRRG